MNEQARQAVLNRLEDGKLTCYQAHAIAEELGVDPLDVGRAADEAGIRISCCQLGLFGYGSKADGTYKIVRPMARCHRPWRRHCGQKLTRRASRALPCGALPTG